MNEDIEMKDSSKTKEKEETKEEVSKEEREKLILEGTEKKSEFYALKLMFFYFLGSKYQFRGKRGLKRC